MGAISETLRQDLRQPEFSEGYAESFQDAYVATQIKVLREQNKWTQAALAKELDTTQTVISRIENVNYSSWNISTLKKLARAFRVRLKVSFETYGSLIHDVDSFSRKDLQRAPRESDPELLDAEESVIADLPENVAAMTAAEKNLRDLTGRELTADELELVRQHNEGRARAGPAYFKASITPGEWAVPQPIYPGTAQAELLASGLLEPPGRRELQNHFDSNYFGRLGLKGLAGYPSSANAVFEWGMRLGLTEPLVTRVTEDPYKGLKLVPRAEVKQGVNQPEAA